MGHNRKKRHLWSVAVQTPTKNVHPCSWISILLACYITHPSSKALNACIPIKCYTYDAITTAVMGNGRRLRRAVTCKNAGSSSCYMDNKRMTKGPMRALQVPPPQFGILILLTEADAARWTSTLIWNMENSTRSGSKLRAPLICVTNSGSAQTLRTLQMDTFRKQASQTWST